MGLVKVSNILNRQKKCCVDYDIDDEGEAASFHEQSVDSWLGIVAAVGMLWEL